MDGGVIGWESTVEYWMDGCVIGWESTVEYWMDCGVIGWESTVEYWMDGMSSVRINCRILNGWWCHRMRINCRIFYSWFSSDDTGPSDSTVEYWMLVLIRWMDGGVTDENPVYWMDGGVSVEINCRILMMDENSVQLNILIGWDNHQFNILEYWMDGGVIGWESTVEWMVVSSDSTVEYWMDGCVISWESTVEYLDGGVIGWESTVEYNGWWSHRMRINCRINGFCHRWESTVEYEWMVVSSDENQL